MANKFCQSPGPSLYWGSTVSNNNVHLYGELSWYMYSSESAFRQLPSVWSKIKPHHQYHLWGQFAVSSLPLLQGLFLQLTPVCSSPWKPTIHCQIPVALLVYFISHYLLKVKVHRFKMWELQISLNS